MKPGPKMGLTPSPSSRTRFQSFLEPGWNLEPVRGFSSNSVSPFLEPTNNKKKKKIEGRFHSFTPTEQRRVAVEYAPPTRPLLTAPTVVFVTEQPQLWAGSNENGWRHRLTQLEYARHRTGRNAATGQYTLAVAVRHRRNGLVRFDADLWKLAVELSPAAISRLYRRWHDLNADYSLPKKILRRMDCHFSRTTIIFDVTVEQVEEWKGFLAAVLSNRASYIDIAARNRLARKLDTGR